MILKRNESPQAAMKAFPLNFAIPTFVYKTFFGIRDIVLVKLIDIV